jgi:hypothetical protein
MPRELDDEALAEGSAHQARASAARDDGEARFGRRAEDRGRLGRAAWEGDTERLHAMDRGVRGVKLSGEFVKGDLAVRAGEQGTLLGRGHCGGTLGARNVNSEFRIPKPERSPNSEIRRLELLRAWVVRPSGLGFPSGFGLLISDFRLNGSMRED